VTMEASDAGAKALMEKLASGAEEADATRPATQDESAPAPADRE